MKKLVACIIVGTAVLVALQVLHQQQAPPPAADAPRIDSTTAAPRSDAAVAPAAPSPTLPYSTAVAREPARVAPVPAVKNAIKPDTQDWDAPCACAAGWLTRNQEREEAARKAEAKDVYWAYETEQLLEQFFAAQPQVRTIRISAIDCRTSFCEITAIGPPDAWEAFQAVVAQAPKEPWSTLGDNSSYSAASRDDGQSDYDVIIERKPVSTGSTAARPPASEPRADEEECACATPEWRMRKARHEAAARAAEPKDIDWAYAMEQRLQQFIAAQPRAETFQVSRVDCRTTFCEIEATGLTDQSSDIFSAIIGGPSSRIGPDWPRRWNRDRRIPMVESRCTQG